MSEEKKVYTTEKAKTDVKTKEDCEKLTDEQMAKVAGGSALGVKADDTVILEQSDALLTGAALKVD